MSEIGKTLSQYNVLTKEKSDKILRPHNLMGVLMARGYPNQTTLYEDIESLFKLALKIQDKLDGDRCKKALLSLRTAVKEFKRALIEEEIDSKFKVAAHRLGGTKKKQDLPKVEHKEPEHKAHPEVHPQPVQPQKDSSLLGLLKR